MSVNSDSTQASAFEGTILSDGSWDWCDRGTSHVVFERNDRLPLKEEDHLVMALMAQYTPLLAKAQKSLGNVFTTERA